ncbi:efflux transporter outer membrane subunit [Alcanivorax sp.]|uniref:efflux transporter outer membrane subunit n=1 Tax=Alcanivorax sp. TaxID=1872427 RepID=UPI002B27A555|nr:efflux transporter outer membrane subunit [Alcanivorax sp.]
MTRNPLTLALLGGLMLGGCTLAPSYEQPASPVPAQLGETAIDGASELTLPGWSSLYQSAELQQLIQSALDNNRDLRLAVLDVAALRAQYQIQRADLYPNLSVDGSGSRQRLPGDLSGTGRSTLSDQYGVQVGVTAWELDLFGRVRSLKDASLENYLASEEAQRSTRLALVAQVAQSYLTLVSDRQNLAISHETVAAQEDSLALIQRRFESGLGTELDVRQAQIALQGARANQASFERQVSQDYNALAVLVGGPLPDLESVDLDSDTLALVAPVPEGLSSTLLTQRPDVQQAEHQLRAANASIGAARAAFFPSIQLTGAYGSMSSELSGLFDSGSKAWSFSPSISLPIFSGGRNKANLELAEVRQDQAVATYEKAIQTAFQEVANALQARDTLARQQQAQQALVTATEQSLTLSQQRYEQGADDYLAVLDAQRTLLSARQQLVTLKLQQLTNETELYRALGGGWDAQQPTHVASR